MKVKSVSHLLAFVPTTIESVFEARVSSVRRQHQKKDCDGIPDALNQLKDTVPIYECF